MGAHNWHLLLQSGNLSHSFKYNSSCYEITLLSTFISTYWKIVLLNIEWVRDIAIKYFTNNKKQMCIVPISYEDQSDQNFDPHPTNAVDTVCRNMNWNIQVIALTDSLVYLKKNCILGFLGGAVVKNLPANAGDTDSSPGLGRSHMPRSN